MKPAIHIAMEDLTGGEAPLPSLWPEDTVEYRIYPDLASDQANVAPSLQRVALECNHASRRLSASHVWYFAAFALRPGPAKGSGGV